MKKHHIRNFRFPRCAALFFLMALACDGAESTFRYFRFTPTELRDDLNANSVQLSEFGFALDQDPIDMAMVIVTNPNGDNPTGEEPENVIDNDTGSKWLDFEKGALVFDFTTPVTTDRYRFATSSDEPGRDPVSWTLEGSEDGMTWLVIDQRTSHPTSTTREAYEDYFVLPGSLDLGILEFRANHTVILNGANTMLHWDVINATSIEIDQGIGSVSPIGSQTITPPANSDTDYVISASKAAVSIERQLTVRSVQGGESTFRYVRFSPRKLRDNSTASSIQLAEFFFVNDNAPVTVVAASNPGGNNPSFELPANIIDNDPGTKWLDFHKGNLVFDFGVAKTFDSYAFTTANDEPERDPVRWILEGSGDGVAWTLIENFTAFDFPISDQRGVRSQDIPLPGSSLIVLPPAPPLAIISSAFDFNAGEIILTFTSAENRSYRVTTSPNLSDWNAVLAGGIPGAAGQASTTVTLPFTVSNRGFFRVQEQ